MDQDSDVQKKKTGLWIRITVLSLTVIALSVVLLETEAHPRTDDASVRANFIAIAPEVGGRLTSLPVRDNAHVHKGDLLFEIDARDYEYALQQALADQDNLEQRIADTRRKIAAENSAVDAAHATVRTSITGVKTAGSGVDFAKAGVARAHASADAAQAHLNYVTNDFHRLEPLLAKKYVTVDQVDQADTEMRVARGQYDQAVAALTEAQAEEDEAELRHEQAGDQAVESRARLGQAIHIVDTLDILASQRPSMAARVDKARLDLQRCRVLAPFDAYVTDMTISEGAYAHVGAPMFTLIDARRWWVVANYREGKMSHIHPGDRVDVYLMGHPERRFDGVVESEGYGVFPEDGNVSNGLPNIERTLNWVHLSTRFPVRILVSDPDPALFRIGATAVTIVR